MHKIVKKNERLVRTNPLEKNDKYFQFSHSSCLEKKICMEEKIKLFSLLFFLLKNLLWKATDVEVNFFVTDGCKV